MTKDFDDFECSQSSDWMGDDIVSQDRSWEILPQEQPQQQRLQQQQQQETTTNQLRQQQQQQQQQQPPLTLQGDYPSLSEQLQSSPRPPALNEQSSCGESTATATCSSTSESSAASPRVPSPCTTSREDGWLVCTTTTTANSALDTNNHSLSNPSLAWDVDAEQALFDSNISAAEETTKTTALRLPPKDDGNSTFQSTKKTRLDSTSGTSIFPPEFLVVDDLENLVVAQQESLMPSNTRTTGTESNSVNTVETKSADGLSDLTQELNSMTLQEREKAMYDLHGVSGHLPEQDAEKVAQWLHQMDELIPQHAKEHPGLAKALQVDAQYVQNERMKFLRSDEYDPVKAAERMGFYFDMKHEYFCGRASSGECDHKCLCIARDLTINDLTEDDIKFWRTGFYQVCREKDRAGRIVCIVFLPLCYQLQIPVESMARVYLVMNTILTQNEDVQRSGNVHIAYAVGLGEDSTKFIGSEHFAKSVVRAGRWAPLRGVAKHFCYDHESLHPMFAKYAKPMATFNAVRFRSHFGTNAEVMYNLMTFGISADSLPVSNGSAVDTAFHNSFIDSLLQQQQKRDEQQRAFMEKQAFQMQALEPTPLSDQQLSEIFTLQDGDRTCNALENPMCSDPMKSSFDEIDVFDDEFTQICSDDNESTTDLLDTREAGQRLIFALSQTDVILGRGTHNKNNPGNLRLKLLLEKHYDAYNDPSLNRLQKTAIVNSILKQMEDAGSRFVYPADEDIASAAASGSGYPGWILATPDKARDKITHDFRNMRRAVATSRGTLRKDFVVTPEQTDDLSELSRLLSIPSPTNSSDQSRSTKASAVRMPSNLDSEVILNPNEMDILLGRNRRKGNIGNKLLKEVLEEHYYEYEAANQSKGVTANAEKIVVVRKVLARMETHGVRFLVHNPAGYWVEAPPEKIHDKMTQDFRNIRWAKKKKSQQMDGAA